VLLLLHPHGDALGAWVVLGLTTVFLTGSAPVPVAAQTALLSHLRGGRFNFAQHGSAMTCSRVGKFVAGRQRAALLCRGMVCGDVLAVPAGHRRARVALRVPACAADH
jgi:hypothetical protein